MDIYLLFRKKSPLTKEGMLWLRGALEHEFTAWRNSSGRAVVSAVLVRSLLACLDRHENSPSPNPFAIKIPKLIIAPKYGQRQQAIWMI